MVRFVPWRYQDLAIEFMIEKPACALFLDLGMGKTVCTLTAIDRLINDRYEVSKVLVVAPLRVAQDTWSREAGKWDHLKHLRISKMLGSEAERINGLAAEADIYVINRENVAWLVDEIGSRWPFDMVVIDELSSFKNPSAVRFKKLKKVRSKISRIVGLTGTPTPNGLLDLWPQIYLLDQGERLGKTMTGYKERYFEPDKRNRTVVFSWRLKAGADERIHELISDVCISMSSADYLELPDRIDVIDLVKLDDLALKKYRTMERDWLLELKGEPITAVSAAAVTNKLLQISNGGIYDENRQAVHVHTAKLDTLADLIEAANGSPVLVFYNFRFDEANLLKRFPEAVVLKGEKEISDWNKGRIPVLLAHPASAGHGLNLQDGGHQIIWYGMPWSLELYQQANGRLHRQGQQHPVVVHHLVCEGTMDEQVVRILNDKRQGQDALLEAVKARLEDVA